MRRVKCSTFSLRMGSQKSFSAALGCEKKKSSQTATSVLQVSATKIGFFVITINENETNGKKLKQKNKMLPGT